MGFLYVLNSNGSPREGWPIQMGEIQGQPLVADLNNDGQLEICVGEVQGQGGFRESGWGWRAVWVRAPVSKSCKGFLYPAKVGPCYLDHSSSGWRSAAKAGAFFNQGV